MCAATRVSIWREGASQPIVVRSGNYIVRRVTVSAHALLLTRFFLSEIISKILHIFTHAASRDMRRADRSSQPENSPPFDGMRCNLR